MVFVILVFGAELKHTGYTSVLVKGWFSIEMSTRLL